MRIKLLYFEGCPSFTQIILERALSEEEPVAQIVPVALVPDDRFSFPNSLSILVDGRVFSPRDVAYAAPNCRICARPEEPPDRGADEMIVIALSPQLLVSAFLSRAARSFPRQS